MDQHEDLKYSKTENEGLFWRVNFFHLVKVERILFNH